MFMSLARLVATKLRSEGGHSTRVSLDLHFGTTVAGFRGGRRR